ncbi:leucyl aminopeptidase [Glaciihabitans tibetensis]|uniref:Probable cytosol aminopeptidase n=1 Tax=Glaciihabitans tibetensis TaxID=1266600 RepID=A0A2T0VJC0_9MICO|nr:leucyl aminopeptidase [Glaciihabitans tibetensis]PRY70312.1 leucyl aminopeptidase [Glaciihabitans tibetensis]
MTVPVLTVSALPATTIDVDVLVVGVRKTEDGPRLLLDDPGMAGLQDQLALIGVTGAVDELRRLPSASGAARSIALVGVGSTVSPDDLRYAAGAAARQLRGIDSIAIALPTETADDLLAVLEGAALGAYDYTAYRVSSLKSTKTAATSIVVASGVDDSDALVARAAVTAVAVHTVRDLVNAPPSHLYPETLAQASIDLAEGLPVEVEVLAEAELAAGGFGGILGVGLGSSRGPRLVKVSYSPAGAERHLALVGKGITFDSGGLSLKPPASMIGMKYDMTGAATALAVTLAVAKAALPVRVTAWLCIAENMPSGTAARPNDVLTLRGGKTVEVLNTDAEGRLVLADGLIAASEEQPDAIIDIATLTGAQVVALGNRYVGAMGDEALVTQIVATATRVGETLWPMPLPAYLRALLNSDVADIANIKPGNTASGMLLAGVFLQDFVGSVGEGDAARTIPWAHLDIAGPAENSGGGYGFTPHGPTGVTVRALFALAEEFSLA